MYLAESTSSSTVADFITEVNGQAGLHYEYLSKPNQEAKRSMNIHYGTAQLIYFKDNNLLKGEYYNQNKHGRGHTGNMKFEFEGKNLYFRFNKNSQQGG